MKWKTKEGKEIDIKDMETSHIKNVMSLFEKKSSIKTTEYCDTGYDGDSYVADFIKVTRPLTKKELLEYSPIYKEMTYEIRRRQNKI